MKLTAKIDSLLEALAARSEEEALRLRAELHFANQLAAHLPQHQIAWQELILRAGELFQAALAKGADLPEALAAAEELLAPMGREAKTYTIHCIGHAHIDMNWMWGWPETVAVINDTFTTIDQLMDEFPDFLFSQSQASIYQVLQNHLPELNARIKQRIKEGRWEVTASHWVEPDKNMSSGESLCRHLLYTRRFFKHVYDFPYEKVQIDWSADAFGHAATLPTILKQAGVRWYYLHRSAHGPKLFWWQGPDGARVLVFDDCARGYNGAINTEIARGLLDFERTTGLKIYPFVYGVGDHGGGPTRQYLQAAIRMNAWPIFPQIKFSTVAAFFALAEQAPDLPVISHELNFLHEGCYTSQGQLKYANRRSENALVEAEAYAWLGRSLVGFPYPSQALYEAWIKTLFNQFHDILPGSCVRATRDYSLGLFQEIMTRTSMAKTRALRAIAAQINTAAVKVPPAASSAAADNRLGTMTAGHGDLDQDGAVTRRGPGGDAELAFTVFNPHPWIRSEMINTRLWDRPDSETAYAVYDDAGQMQSVQLNERGVYWTHTFSEISFPATQVPALGYRTYRLVPLAAASGAEQVCHGDGRGRMENEFFKVQVEASSGAIISLWDKSQGVELVPKGGRLGLLEYVLEAPHVMTSWIMGQPLEVRPFLSGASVEYLRNGPQQCAVRVQHKLNDSTFSLTIALSAGQPRLDFTLDVHWLERGTPEKGVPSLKVAFPLAVTAGVARYEIPNGNVVRSVKKAEVLTHTTRYSNCYTETREGIDPNPAEVPALQWADLSGLLADGKTPAGASLLNTSRYGHSIIENTMRLTLLRSSYEPDLLPEFGQQTIRFALRPHVGSWSVFEAARAGHDFNTPLSTVAVPVRTGQLPSAARTLEILTPNIMLSGLKKAEDSDALIVRLYEMEGRATTARLWFDPALLPSGAQAQVTDIMERPLSPNGARLEDGILHVDLPAHGMATVSLG